MRILRLTRHSATTEQLAELLRIFGSDVDIVEHDETVSGAPRVSELVRETAADVLEAVLPLPILAEVVGPRGVGIPVIRAVTRREIGEDGTKAIFVFAHYERVLKVEIVTERL